MFAAGCTIYLMLPRSPLPLYFEPAFWILLITPFTGAGLGWMSWQRRRGMEELLATSRRRHKRKTQALRQRESLSRAVFDNTPDAIFVVDHSGTIQDCNAASLRIFGYSNDELIGRDIEELIPNHAHLLREDRIDRRAVTGLVLGSEWHVRGRHADGMSFPIDLARTGLRALPAMVYVAREATTRVDREENRLRQTMDAQRDHNASTSKRRGDILDELGRALRTEVEALLGQTDDLQAFIGALADHIDIDPAVEGITSTAHALMPIVDRLQNLSMVDDSRSALDIESVTVASLVEDLTAALRPTVARHNIELVVRIGENMPTLHTDRPKLAHAVRNLLNNAVYHTDNGTVTLEVEREPGRGTDWVAFFVSDTGDGMSQNDIDGLFQAFTDESGTASLYLESGLGLALSQHCTKLLGGHISVRSVVGEGSTFILRVPVRPGRAGSFREEDHGRERLDSDPPH